jgi:hypothetical protein
VTSTLTTSSARSRNVSGTVSRTRTPVTRADGVVERFEVLDVDGREDADAGVEDLEHVLEALLVPAAGALVWASSSTTHSCGLRATIAATSISSRTTPRYSTFRRGRFPGP